MATYTVTNLDNSGAGSLRAQIAQPDVDRVEFAVSGEIHLLSNLSFSGLTDIVVTNAAGSGPVYITGKRIRFGDGAARITLEHLWVMNNTLENNSYSIEIDGDTGTPPEDITFKHCGFGWSQDDIVLVWTSASNIRFENCIFFEGLDDGTGKTVATSVSTGDSSDVIYLHCYFLLCQDRMPNIAKVVGPVAVINSVVYAWDDQYSAVRIADASDQPPKADLIGVSFYTGPMNSESPPRPVLIDDADDGGGGLLMDDFVYMEDCALNGVIPADQHDLITPVNSRNDLILKGAPWTSESYTVLSDSQVVERSGPAQYSLLKNRLANHLLMRTGSFMPPNTVGVIPGPPGCMCNSVAYPEVV